jgi:lipopolysaccharide/colanic/teichoic acid biosynthesis glycosyltransferase
MLTVVPYSSARVMFDLEILFATIPVVLFGKGAY